MHDAANSTKNLEKFSDSEQKILTRMLLDGQYPGNLTVRMLSKKQFPSGFDYFNLHSSLRDLELKERSMRCKEYSMHKEHKAETEQVGKNKKDSDRYCQIDENDAVSNGQSDTDSDSVLSPAVIHNNFMIGRKMKEMRFQRYGLWTVIPGSISSAEVSSCGRPSQSESECGSECEGASESGRGSESESGIESRDRNKRENENEREGVSVGQLKYCGYNSLNQFQRHFSDVERDIALPSLSIILPVHDTILDGTCNVLTISFFQILFAFDYRTNSYLNSSF